jgi:tripartite-type tricarboxylate transporter receptor subunit TctC
MVVAVSRSGPFSSLSELVAAAKAKPGALTYGSGGGGSAAHIAAEIFKWKTGTDFLHVPYKGVGAAVPDLVAGRLDAMFVSYPPVRPMSDAVTCGFSRWLRPSARVLYPVCRPQRKPG